MLHTILDEKIEAVGRLSKEGAYCLINSEWKLIPYDAICWTSAN